MSSNARRVVLLGVTAAAIATGLATGFQRPALAQKKPDVCTVPKAFGAFKGFSIFSVFEDASGTIRFVNCEGGAMTVVAEIKRQ
jgi:hypothetical protein